MKALFLGAFAASQAERIARMIESEVTVESLADERDKARIATALAAAEIVVGLAWDASRPPARRLRLLQLPAAGTDQIDLAALPKGVTVCNAYGHESAIAEYIIMAMLAWFHRYFEIAAAFRAGSWRDSGEKAGPLHRELAGHTVGILGFGPIGREVARRAAALGCRILAANRSPRETVAGVERIFPLAELDRMLPECDVVALCSALAPETRGLIDARRLALMKPNAFLINVGRGPIADEDALYCALRDRRIGGAALDTWWRYPSAEDPEPRPSRHPFHELPNVVMTPHCSAWTEEMVERRGGAVARNIDQFVRGQPLLNVVATT